MFDLLLKGGEVVDPSQGLRAFMDVAVTDGVISQVSPSIDPRQAQRVIDVSGKIVAPGLIDLHTHVYAGVNRMGIDPDLAGVRSGVTTVVDVGSAGPYTFGGFPRYLAPRAKTRLLCMVHIVRTGLSYIPELGRREDIDVEEAVRTIQEHRPLVQGVKLRAVGPAVPTLGIEMVRLAKEAARQGGVRLMVHIGDPTAGDGPTLTRQLLPLLEPGDILTHLFTGNPGRILDDAGRVIPELMEAQERGVFLDTAHGRMNFSFDVARRALDQGVRPRSISTDITLPGWRNTVHSMTEQMSRFMALGFSLEDVIRMATVEPATALGMADTLGSLQVGRVADVTVLEVATGAWLFDDTFGGTLRGDKALAPVLTLREGEPITPDWGPHPWGWLPPSAD